jgi:hypothetical protein
LVVAHRDRLRQVMTFAAQAPGAGFGRRAEHRKREALRRALARAIAGGRQNVLQQHDILRLGDAGGRPDVAEHGPRRLLQRRAHLLEPEPRLDEATNAEIIPAAPLRAVPGKARGLALLRIEAVLKAAHAVEQIGGRGKAGRIGRGRGPGQRRHAEQGCARCDDAAAIVGELLHGALHAAES